VHSYFGILEVHYLSYKGLREGKGEREGGEGEGEGWGEGEEEEGEGEEKEKEKEKKGEGEGGERCGREKGEREYPHYISVQFDPPLVYIQKP
jgi:hypothetical protein